MCYSLSAITCENPTPPTGLFLDHICSNDTEVTLYVPKGSVSAYSIADGWKNFKEIKEIGVSPETKIDPTGIDVSPSSKTIKVGGTFTATYTLTPSDATTTVTWTSDDSSIASVDSSGKVTGKKAGSTYINAETANGKTDWCKVTVEGEKVDPTGIDVSPSSKTIKVGGTFTATYTLTPSDATTTVAWSSDDSSIASVDSSGKVTGKKAGSTYINVETANGKKDWFKVTVEGDEVEPMKNVKQVAAGYSYSLMLKTDGTLWACGRNHYGQLGDGTTTDRKTPVKVMDGVASVAAGSYHSLIVKTDGTLWACGSNDYGQLGDGTTTDRTTPVKVIDGVASVASKYFHSLILKTDGTLWACGHNNDGQLGDGTTTDRTTPVKVMDGVASMAAGGWHSLILKTDGTLWACGSNYFGQLGDGTTTDRTTPVKVMDGVASMAAGNNHSLILKTDGTLWACGSNNHGRLGDGTNIDRATPVNTIEGVVITPTNITVSPSLITIKVTETFTATYTLTPSDATTTVTWSSDDYTIADVDANTGMVTGKKAGTTYINATTENGKTSRCEVVVESNTIEPTNIDVSPSSKSIKVNESFTATYSLAPSDATTTVTWSSDDYTIADVDANTGKVTGKKAGNTYINANTSNGKVGKCKVVVETNTLEVQLSNAGYATFYDSQSAYVLPNGLSAQVVTNATNSKLTYKTIADGSVAGVIPKGTAVMLASDAKQSGKFVLTSTESNTTYSGTNLLRGSDVATTTTGDGLHFKLCYGQTGTKWDNVFGWYWGAQNGAAFQIDGHKAWLVVQKSAATRGYTIDDEATGIADVEAGVDDGTYYDLQGRIVSTPVSRRLYIKNGKIIVIK